MFTQLFYCHDQERFHDSLVWGSRYSEISKWESKVKVDENVKIQSYNNTKVTNNTFETNCSSLKITTPSIFFLQILKIQLYLIVTIFLFLTDIIITFTFNSLLSVLIYCLEGKNETNYNNVIIKQLPGYLLNFWLLLL